MQSIIQRFNWVEKFDFSSVLQLLAVSTNSVIRVRIVLEFLRQQSISISIDTWDRSRWWASSKKSYLYNERQNEIAMSETYENLNVGICDFSKSWNRIYWFIFLPESKQNSKVDPTTICSMSSNTFCSSPLSSGQTLCPACLQ